MGIEQRTGEVRVLQIPDGLSRTQRSTFLDDFTSLVDVLRPSIVLDCSQVREMNHPILELMLYCLEEAMKRNGDVRLASASSQARTILEGNGIARLFQIYDTNAEAVASFRRLSKVTDPQILPPEWSHDTFGNAA